MEEAMIPSLSTGVVGSRFVTSNEVEAARARRDEQWKAAYARLGQEPPPQPVEDSYDGRSLAEKLAANKASKQEEWEEKTKLANQFRALEEDEIMFLDSLREKEDEEERQRKEHDGEEVKNFKEAVAARTSAVNKPPPTLSSMTSTQQPASKIASMKPSPTVLRKDAKKALKGVLVKRPKAAAASLKTKESKETVPAGEKAQDAGTDAPPDAKRRRVSET